MSRRVPAALLLLAASVALAGDGDVAGLSADLSHPNPVVRARAAEALGRSGETRALVPLLLALRDGSASVRARAAEALRVLGDERAVPFLDRALGDVDATVRCRALLALGDLGDRYVLPALGRHLGDPAAVVRAAAVRAIGEIGDPLSLDAVLEAQRREPEGGDEAVAACALVAAAKLGGPKGLSRSLELAAGRLERSWFLRAVAAHAAGLAGDVARIPDLEEALRTDPDPRVCQSAAAALAGLGARDRLEEALADGTPFRRRAAVAGLARLPAEEARGALLAATRDPDPGVVLEAASTLFATGEAEAAPLLIALLEEGDAPIWMGALDALEAATGLAFGRNPPRWSEWFGEHRERLRFRPETGRFEAGR